MSVSVSQLLATALFLMTFNCSVSTEGKSRLFITHYNHIQAIHGTRDKLMRYGSLIGIGACF